ncbi:MAG: PASTA domain-containing protein [Provencibacterium sp.]|nr:PASTA domain-containing protein [Provencibacterium sp.]
MTDKTNLCMGCMMLLDSKGPCSYCGYNDSEPYNVNYLPPHTQLQQRYIVGRLLSENGEGACYIGYDLEEDYRVILREFAPLKLAARNHATLELMPIREKETAFKNLQADFEDLCSMLRGMQNIRGITQVLDIFHENGTVYAAFRYMNTLSLGTLISRCGGEIPWTKCKKMYLQLLNTASQIHKRGLIHAGISPETILVDEKGNAYFSHFSVNVLRYANSEIESELFDGYCAPEQYEASASFGEWTDIYALSAVVYRMITGTQPPDAPSRREQDNLLAACELDSSIPKNISDAIHAGLALSIDERTPTADALAAQLLDCIQTNTAIYQGENFTQDIHAALDASEETEKEENPPMSRRQQRKQEKLEKRALKRKKKRRALRSFLIALVTILLTSMGLGGFIMFYLSRNYDDIQNSVSHFVSVGERSSSSASGSSSEPTIVPDFIGQLAEKITSNKDYSASFDLSVVYQYNDEHPTAGEIFDQSPKEGTRMSNRGTVILYVSKGPETTRLPNLAGSTVELAIQTLEGMELQYQVIYVINDSYADGLVAYTSPAADSMVSKNDEILIFTKNTEAASSEASGDSSESSSSSSEESRPKARKVLRDESSSKNDW